jgi:hypothetical protein
MRKLPESRLGRAAVAALALAIAAGAGAVVFALTSSSGSPLSFVGSGVDFSGARTYPGQTESFAEFVTANPAGVAFQVQKVSLIPLPGFRTPKLVGAMFLVNVRNIPFQARRFPPVTSTGQPYPVHTITGYTVKSGIKPYQPPLTLEIGLSGADLGGYAVAGIRITYVVDGRSYTTGIYNGADLFYYPQHQSRADRRASLAAYSSYDNRAANAQSKLPPAQAVLAATHH